MDMVQSSRVAIALFALVVVWPAPHAVAQERRADGEMSESATQTFTGQGSTASKRDIVINEKGPVDTGTFGDAERPFLLAHWLCDRDAKGITVTLEDLLKPTGDRRACESTLNAVWSGQSGNANTRVTVTNASSSAGAAKPARLSLQVRNSVTGEICKPGLPDIEPGEGRTFDLTTIRCGDSKRVDFAVIKHGEGGAVDEIVSVFSVSFELPPNLKALAGTSSPTVKVGCTTMMRYTVRLDATGVESTRLRNPRRPLYLDPASSPGGSPYACAELALVNELVARQFVVTFAGIDAAARYELMAVPGATTKCPGSTCTVSVRVGGGSPVVLPLSALYKGYVRTKLANGTVIPPYAEVTAFNVSFFDDDREPAFPRGYFSLVQYHSLVERKSESAWSSAASVDLGAIPDLGEFDAKFAATNTTIYTTPFPTVRPADGRGQGNVRVTLKQNLGSRASADFEVRLKSGELGSAEQSITATRLRIDVFLYSGATLTGGRGIVAAPSEGIALFETGDSVGVRWWHFQANHLFRRQVRNSTPVTVDPGIIRADRDHWTTIVQATGLPLDRRVTLDGFYAFGRREQARYGGDPTKDQKSLPAETNVPAASLTTRRYSTVGGEIGWMPRPALRLASAYYKSRADTDLDGGVPSSTDEGRGTAWLSTASWTNFDGGKTSQSKLPIDWTFQARYARGSAELDDEQHVTRQEAYLGESARFAPDEIFLASIAPVMHVKDGIHPTLGRGGALTPGLGNKEYRGAVVNFPRLAFVSRLLRTAGLPPDVFGDTAANFRWHSYRLRTDVPGGRHLGTEIDMAVAFEMPKGVKSTLTIARFSPGGALKSAQPTWSSGLPQITKDVWSIVGAVAVPISQ